MIIENLNKFLNSFWVDCRKFIICILVFLILLVVRDKYLYKKVNKMENKYFYIVNIYKGKIRFGMD